MSDNTLARLQRGTTLVEACCAVSIAAAVAGAVVPSFDTLRLRRTVEGVAAEVATDLHFARTEAVSRRVGVSWTLRDVPAGGTCAVIHTGDPAHCECAADGVAACGADSTVIKSTYFLPSGRVSVAANVGSMRFHADSGTTTPAGTVRIAVPGGGPAVHHVVNIMGRVRSCSPGGSLAGVRPC